MTGQAEMYTELACTQFLSQLDFDPSYDPAWTDIPDYDQDAIEKQSQKIGLSVFAQQPVVKVKDRRVIVATSSYLFNPPCNLEDAGGAALYLPDLEVVVAKGSDLDVGIMRDAIQDLYVQRNGWQMYVHRVPEMIPTMKVDTNNAERGLGKIDVFRPVQLFSLAGKHVGYDISRLCFDNS